MGYLGFDRQRLTVLANAVARAGDELIRLDLSDPAASISRNLLEVANRILLVSQSVMLSVARSDVLSAYRPVSIGSDDLPHAMLFERQTLDQWSIVNDPNLDGPPTDEERTLDAEATGWMLATGTDPDLLSVANERALTLSLRSYATDPHDAEVFVASLGDDGLSRLDDRLEAQRRPLPDRAAGRSGGAGGSTQDHSSTDALMAALVGVISASRPARPPTEGEEPDA